MKLAFIASLSVSFKQKHYYMKLRYKVKFSMKNIPCGPVRARDFDKAWSVVHSP